MDYSDKENLSEVDYKDCLEKIRNIPVYNFNYVRTNPESVETNALGEHFYPFFGGGLLTEEICDEEGECILDKFGEKTYYSFRAKNSVDVKVEDMVGVLMACVKGLQQELDALKERLVFLEN